MSGVSLVEAQDHSLWRLVAGDQYELTAYPCRIAFNDRDRPISRLNELAAYIPSYSAGAETRQNRHVPRFSIWPMGQDVSVIGIPVSGVHTFRSSDHSTV